MKLTNDEFKKFKELKAKKSLTPEETELLKALEAKKKAKEDDFKKDVGNDFSWWNKFPQLVADSANLKSNWIAGTRLVGSDLPYIPTGVVKYTLHAMFGRSIAPTDPLNVFARNLFLMMFQKYRGISAYSASDLVIALMAVVEVIRTIAKLERIYGVVNRYSKRNVNMPTTEEVALGITNSEATWIRNHLSDFRYDLNVLIQRAQRLCIPKDMSIIADSISLLGYEYLDHDNDRAQIIVFDTDTFGVFEDTLLQSGGCIRYQTFGGATPLIDTTGSSDNMFVALEMQLNALLGSDGIQKIFGDLIVWFGEDQLLHLNPIEDNYIIAPVFSESILHKMHNMNQCAGGVLNAVKTDLPAADQSTLQSASEFIIYQDNDVVISDPHFITPGHGVSWQSDNGYLRPSHGQDYFDEVIHAGADIIDTYRTDVTPEVIVEGSLFKYRSAVKTVVDAGGTPYYYCVVESVGFWYILQVTLLSLTAAGTVATVNVNLQSVSDTLNQSGSGLLAILDWAPLTKTMVAGGITKVYGDLDMPIPIYNNTLYRILNAVLYSGMHTDVKVITK